MTSAEVTAAALKREMPGCNVFVVGEEGIRHALAEAGFHVTTDHRRADAVVLGMDRTLTYARLRDANFAVRRGARFLATNNDRTLPSDIGIIPGAGSLLIALETASDVKATVIGKPSPVIFSHALARLGTPAEVTACVGDRPETDIEGGHAIGLRTIGVLCGVGTREGFAELASPPDWIFEDLAELGKVYFG
jgi:4-nitrophenyl phosphatase